MISILAFIIVMFGSLNWLCIGFFQYDIVAGLFGFQGSIFSRIVYIIVGICAIYLIFVIIKNKGRLTVKKLKKLEQPMVDKMTKKSPEQIAEDQQLADQVIYESEHHHDPQYVNYNQIPYVNATITNPEQHINTNPNYSNQVPLQTPYGQPYISTKQNSKNNK